MEINVKKIPYGEANYKDIITHGYIFIDKTKYIEILENLDEKCLVFLRPRKFGKTLFLSMLKYYYDLNENDNFLDLFKDFYIGKHPTKLHNSYLILSFNFSGIEAQTFKTTYEGFFSNVIEGIEKFISDYFNIFTSESIKRIKDSKTPEEIVMRLFTEVGKTTGKIYLLIDEYDHFANELLSFREELFSDIVSKTGFVRKFYEEIKKGKEAGVVERIYITGITPVTLDSITSGFNIKTYIGNDPQFNAMIGFTEDEVKVLIQKLSNRLPFKEEKMFEVLSLNYDGYVFDEYVDENTQNIFNSDMVLYYLNHVVKTKRKPKQLIDFNVASDYSKISFFFKLSPGKTKTEIIDSILQAGSISGSLTAEYSLAKKLSRDDIISLLYYLGLLTIGGQESGEIKFNVPNYVIHTLYWQYFLDELEQEKIIDIDTYQVKQSIKELAFKGNPVLFIREVEKVLEQLSNRDLMKFDEKYIKLVMILLLNLTRIYYIKSEYEEGTGYADLLLMGYEPFGVKYNYIFEIKYIKKKDCSDKKIELKKDEALNQVREKYFSDKKLIKKWGFMGYVLIFSGTKCILQENYHY